MNTANIIEAVSTTEELPIEIPHVIEIIKACEYQDDIKVVGVTPRVADSPRSLLYRYISLDHPGGGEHPTSIVTAQV